MFEQFRQKAEAVSSEVYLIENIEGVYKKVEELILKECPNSSDCALWASGSLFSEADINTHCPKVNTKISLDNAKKAHIGITEAMLGIGDTGTLVFDSTTISGRLISMLPLIHIAIVREDAIVADMAVALKDIDVKKSAYLAFVTGPSRTADIERVLTIGVHGPQRLIILILSK